MRAFFGLLGLAGAGFLVSGVTSAVGCSDSGASPAGSGRARPARRHGWLDRHGRHDRRRRRGGSGGGGGATGTLGCQVSDLPSAAPTSPTSPR